MYKLKDLYISLDFKLNLREISSAKMLPTIMPRGIQWWRISDSWHVLKHKVNSRSVLSSFTYNNYTRLWCLDMAAAEYSSATLPESVECVSSHVWGRSGGFLLVRACWRHQLWRVLSWLLFRYLRRTFPLSGELRRSLSLAQTAQQLSRFEDRRLTGGLQGADLLQVLERPQHLGGHDGQMFLLDQAGAGRTEDSVALSCSSASWPGPLCGCGSIRDKWHFLLRWRGILFLLLLLWLVTGDRAVRAVTHTFIIPTDVLITVFLLFHTISICDINHVFGKRRELVHKALTFHLVQYAPLIVVPARIQRNTNLTL